jgi:hypothetical protein
MKNIFCLGLVLLLLCGAYGQEKNTWRPLADWGHWRLGQKADLEFLTKNHMTITFGSGAPNFESISRDDFNKKMNEAKTFNQNYHDKGYIVLRYLSTSLGGETATNKDEPRKDQIEMLKFYNEQWDNFKDIIGPKPAEDPTTWIMVRPDGTFPHYRYAPYGKETTGGFESWGCPDNPYYVRMMEGKIRQQAATGIDGSYVDWTHIAGGTCYCSYTRQNFIAYLQKNLPADVAMAKYGSADFKQIKLPEKRGDKFWMEWITFRCQAVAGFHKKLRQAAREVNPYFMIAGNVYGGFGYGPIAYDAAGNMEMLGADGYDDFIYSEMQEYLDSAPRKNDQGMKITNSPALKFLSAAAHGKPVIIYATEITPPIFPNPTEKCLSAMAQINIAEAEANHTIFREKRETPPGATAMYSFLAPNESYLLGAHLYSNVAILGSLNQYLADELSFAFSTSRVLADRGISHVFVVEDDLVKNRLENFDLIIIPYVPLLSMEKQEVLQKFVEKGGTLLVLGTSGIKNEYNLPNKKNVFLQMMKLKEFPVNDQTYKVGKGRLVYMALKVPENKFLVKMQLKADATTFGPTMADVFPDIPEGYTRGKIDPQLHQILDSIASRILEFPDIKTTRLMNLAPYVEITTMRQTERNYLLLHLVNYDVTLDGTITPAENLSVQVKIPPGQQVKKVSFSGNLDPVQEVPFKTGPGEVMLQIPKVELYGLAIIELQ